MCSPSAADDPAGGHWLPSGSAPWLPPRSVSSHDRMLVGIEDTTTFCTIPFPPPLPSILPTGILTSHPGQSSVKLLRSFLSQNMSSSPFLRRRAESTPRPCSWELPSRLGGTCTGSYRILTCSRVQYFLFTLQHLIIISCCASVLVRCFVKMRCVMSLLVGLLVLLALGGGGAADGECCLQAGARVRSQSQCYTACSACFILP